MEDNFENSEKYVIDDVFNITKIDKTDKRVQYIIKKDPIIGDYINKKDKALYFLAKDVNQFFVFTIIGQLISMKVANKIYTKFANICNHDFSAKRILHFSREDLRSLGMTYKKADYILSFMEMLNKNKSFFDDLVKIRDENKAIKELLKLHGVGKWTAKMILLACFDYQNIVPVEDLAIFKGYNHLYKCDKTPTQILKDCEKWSPYGSIATRYLYAYIEDVYKSSNPKTKS